jgi:hypothetical protein
MGQALESLPLDDPKGLKQAGGSEIGTYCAVPVAGGGGEGGESRVEGVTLAVDPSTSSQ